MIEAAEASLLAGSAIDTILAETTVLADETCTEGSVVSIMSHSETVTPPLSKPVR
jgi:hypothetical protein